MLLASEEMILRSVSVMAGTISIPAAEDLTVRANLSRPGSKLTPYLTSSPEEWVLTMLSTVKSTAALTPSARDSPDSSEATSRDPKTSPVPW